MNPSTDCTIVTTCVNYGRYLDGWTDSIIALTRRPAECIIFEHGSIDDSPALADMAAAKLVAAGIPARCIHLSERLNIGAAKNRAVAEARTPWIAPLDADDVLLPHALADTAALADRADIIAFGYERCGVVGGRQRSGTRLYGSGRGIGYVARFYPASGNWPFRRWLWERQPYREDMVGAWDTASLIDWCHLQARVVATTRPSFRYVRHDGSVLTLRAGGRGWALHRTDTQIAQLHRRPELQGVSVLVPRDQQRGGDRARLWAYVRAWYAREFPDWQVVEGVSDARHWQKGRAVQAALGEATGAVVVVADADCLIEPAGLREAVELVASGRAPWAVPHQFVHRLTPGATEAQLAGASYDGKRLERPAYSGLVGGGCFVVPRTLFEATGGIPGAFLGWGAEDEATGVILDTLLGKHVRLGYALTHLWHEPQPQPTAPMMNRQRYRNIRHAAHDGPEALWQLLREMQGKRHSIPMRKRLTAAQAAERRRKQSFLVRRRKRA